MTFIRTLCLIVPFWWAGWAIVTQSKAPENPAPSLNEEVIEDLHSNRPERLSPDALLDINIAGVTFLNNQELIVYALEPSGHLSSRRSHETSSAFRLRVRILDIQSGKTLLTKDVNALPHGVAVQVTTGGVLINTGEIVRLYSTDFAKFRDLTSPGGEGDLSIMSVSPTGKTIIPA